MEHTMSYRSSISVAALFLLGGIGTAVAEMPTYEVTGFSITPHQLVVLGPANAEQELSAVTATMAGMPASPLQIAVLTPRRQEHAQLIPAGTVGQVR
jgi:hypothetical protein